MRRYKNLIFILIFSVSSIVTPFFVFSQDSVEQALLIKKIKSLQESIDREGQSIQSLRGKIRGSSSFQKELDARLNEKNKTIEDLRDQLKKARTASDKSDKARELSRQLDAKEREVTEAKEDLTAASRQIQEVEESYKQSQEKQKDLSDQLAKVNERLKSQQASSGGADKLKNELNSKQEAIDDLRRELASKEDELAKANQIKEDFNKQIQEMKDRVVGLEKEVQASPDSSDKDKKISQLQEELAASGQREATLTDQIRQGQTGAPASVSSKQVELENRLAAKDKDLAGLSGELDLAKSELERTRQEKDKTIEALQADLAKSGQGQEELDKKVKEMASQIAGFESVKQAAPDLSGQIKDKDKKLSQLQEELAVLRKQIKDKDTQLTSAKADSKVSEDLSRQVKRAEEKAKVAETALVEKDKKTSQLQEDVAVLRKQIKDKDTQLTSAKAQDKPSRDLPRQIKQAEEKVKAAESALADKNKKISQLQEELAASGQREATLADKVGSSAQAVPVGSQLELVKKTLDLKEKELDETQAKLADAEKKQVELEQKLALGQQAGSDGKREALMDQAMEKTGSGQERDLRIQLASSQKDLKDAKDKLRASQLRQDALVKEIDTVTEQVNQIKAKRYPKESAAAITEKDKRIKELEIKIAAQETLLRLSRTTAGSREQEGNASSVERLAAGKYSETEELSKQLAAKEETLKVLEARLRAYEEEKVTLVKDMNITNNRIQALASKIVREQPQDSSGNKVDMEKLRLAIQEAIARLDDLKSSEGSYN
jgi:chromosome segregation ATPase